MTERLHELFARHLQRRLSVDERTELLGLFLEPTLQNEVQQLVHAAWDTSVEEEELPLEKRELLFSHLFDAKDSRKVISMHRKGLARWIAAAASILLLVMAGAYVFFFYKKNKPDLAHVQPAIDIAAPTTSKAHITLANGTTVLLDSLVFLNEGGVAIVKDKSGHVVYQGSAKEQQYNTLVNPRGSQVVNLLLADGTKVWLNAASSLTYFTGNTGAVREVTITGEGYFEVAKNATRPFIVKKGAASVTVLGTHFNVNAYDDEQNMKVTLLEGSVQVAGEKAGRKILLKPGEQVSISQTYQVAQPIGVLTDSVIAWKNGWFSFNDADVPALMRQLARWYDIEVEYESNIPAQTFSGEISRSLTLNQLLKGVAKTGIRYKFITDKKILILP